MRRVVARLNHRQLSIAHEAWASGVEAAREEKLWAEQLRKMEGMRAAIEIATTSLGESEVARTKLEGMVVSLSEELQQVPHIQSVLSSLALTLSRGRVPACPRCMHAFNVVRVITKAVYADRAVATQVQHELASVRKGSQRVCGVSRDKWRQHFSPPSSSSERRVAKREAGSQGRNYDAPFLHKSRYSDPDTDGDEARRQIAVVRAGLRAIRSEVKKLRRELYALGTAEELSFLSQVCAASAAK